MVRALRRSGQGTHGRRRRLDVVDYCDTVISNLEPRRGFKAGGIRKILTLLLLHQCITTPKNLVPLKATLAKLLGPARPRSSNSTSCCPAIESLGRVCGNDILYFSPAKVISTTSKDYLSWLKGYS